MPFSKKTLERQTAPQSLLVNRLFCISLLLILASRANADWPHVRGSQHDGTSAETGLAETWPAGGPRALWSRTLGQGYSGCVVAQGKVFTQYQRLAGQFVVCLNADTGATLGETRCDWSWQPQGPYPGPYATPTWSSGFVYYTTPSGIVGCMNAESGAALWSLDLHEKFQGAGYEFGSAAAPLVERGLAIIPVGGKNASLVALDAMDGRVIWQAGSDLASYCGVLPIELKGRRLVVGYLKNALLIVEASTGAIVYRQGLSTGYDEHSAWPIYREPDLFLASPFRQPATCLHLEVDVQGAITTTPKWTSREMSNDILSSVLYGDHLYGFDLKQLQASKHRTSHGVFRCLDWNDGKVRWSTEEVGHASVLAADGKIILFTDVGELILARASAEKYEEIGRVSLYAGEDDMCWSPLALSQGRLYVRTPTQLLCLYLGRPENAPDLQMTELSVVANRQSAAGKLISREREYPNDAPSLAEMTEWYMACLTIFAIAGLLTALCHALVLLGARVKIADAPVFYGLSFLLGFAGADVLADISERFLFPWPASLFAAFQATLYLGRWAQQRPARRSGRWLARLGLLTFLVVNYLYIRACTSLGMFIAWGFLIGYLPAFPVSALAIPRPDSARRWRVKTMLTLVAFTIFFWSSEAFFLVKEALQH